MAEDPRLEQLVSALLRKTKYGQLSRSLISRVAAEELERQPDYAHAEKSTRTRLHRLTGAFLTPKLNYAQWAQNFKDLGSASLFYTRPTARNMMRLHASTNERLPYIDEFYLRCLESIQPVTSILDLACGLNPIALPWMPVAENVEYYACDAVMPMVDFLQVYFDLFDVSGRAFHCDLLAATPKFSTQVAFLMKTLPILEQVEKDISARLLDEIAADHLLISYPLKSLGGFTKGMAATYRQQFETLIQDRHFTIREFTFPNELVFLLSR